MADGIEIDPERGTGCTRVSWRRPLTLLLTFVKIGNEKVQVELLGIAPWATSAPRSWDFWNAIVGCSPLSSSIHSTSSA